MNVVDVVGWLAAAIGGVALLPQALKLFRDRQTAGISLMYWQILLGLVSSWVVHGIAIGAANVVAPNTAMALISAYTLILIGRSRSIGVVRLFGPVVALFAVLVTVDVTLGTAAFGLAGIIPGSIGLVGQIVDLVREPDVSGVSWVFLAMAVLMQATWFLWGMLAVEWAIRIQAGVSLLLCAISMSWWIARRAGLPAMGRIPVHS